jgi:hypothetical protein
MTIVLVLSLSIFVNATIETQMEREYEINHVEYIDYDEIPPSLMEASEKYELSDSGLKATVKSDIKSGDDVVTSHDGKLYGHRLNSNEKHSVALETDTGAHIVDIKATSEMYGDKSTPAYFIWTYILGSITIFTLYLIQLNATSEESLGHQMGAWAGSSLGVLLTGSSMGLHILNGQLYPNTSVSWYFVLFVFHCLTFVMLYFGRE